MGNYRPAYGTKPVLARNNEDGLHYIIRVISQDKLCWDIDTDCHAYLDGLLTTKRPPQLLGAISEMPSLYPNGEFRGRSYYCKLSDASDRLSAFSVCDEVQLEAELQIITVRELKSSNARFTKLISEFGFDPARYERELKVYDGNECVLLIERLQDWMTLQTSLALCARLRAQLESGGPVSLERAGFAHRANTRLDDDFYMIPFKFNAFYAREHAKSEDNDPLFDKLAPWSKGETRLSPIDQVHIRYLDREDQSIFFATAPLAGQSHRENLEQLFIARRRAASDKVYYLLAKDDGDEEAIAKAIVSSFTKAFRTLEDPSREEGERELGWVYDETDEFADIDGPRLAARSLPSALWLRLVYHPGMRTITCAYCGNAILARKRGNHKRHCTPACCSQDARRAKRQVS